MLGTEPAQRFQTALKILLGLVPYDALLTLQTARLSNPSMGGDPTTVSIRTIPFKVYQKSCPVSNPCSLQEGVLLRNLEVFFRNSVVYLFMLKCCLLRPNILLCFEVYWPQEGTHT